MRVLGVLGGARRVLPLVVLVSLLLTGGAEANFGPPVLVSRGADGANADGESWLGPSRDMTRDGRHVAFATDALNFGDADLESGAFVRDLGAPATLRGSVGTSAGAVFGVSDGGAFAFFEDEARAVSQAYRTTLATGSKEPVGVTSDEVAADGPVRGLASSADGTLAVFEAEAPNLGGGRHLYLRDLVAGTTTAIDRASSGALSNGSARFDTAFMSANGRFVGFTTTAILDAADSSLDSDGYLHDRQTGATTLVTPGADGATAFYVSDDGTTVAFETKSALTPSDDNPPSAENKGDAGSDVYVWRAGTVALVSSALDGTAGNGPSHAPSLDGAGRHVAFSSTATDLVATAPLDFVTPYVRDLATGRTYQVASHGTDPEVSGDGNSVVFATQEMLDPALDSDGAASVYVRQFAPAVPPVAPTGLRTVPPGPANDNAPEVAGIAPPGAIVEVFRDPGCAGAPLARGSTDQFAIGLTVTVPDDSTTQFSARALADGFTSPCSAPSPVYVERTACVDGKDGDRDGLIDARDLDCLLGGLEVKRNDPLLACAKGARLVLLDVIREGSKVRVTGVADPALAGQRVTIREDGRTKARARISSSGGWSARISKLRKSSAKVQGVLGSLKTKSLRLDTRKEALKLRQSRSNVIAEGDLSASGKRTVELQQRSGCSTWKTLDKDRTDSKGRFKITDRATSSVDVAVYRVRAKVGSRTVTTVERSLVLR